MRAYTTEQASREALKTRTLGLGDTQNADMGDIMSLPLSPGSGYYYMMDFAPNLLSPSGEFTPTPKPITKASNSGLLIGLALLGLVMLSGGHN